jgi:signal transduction histidine kinase
MDTATDLPPLALDRPLPAELTGRNHGWFTRYRTYPVFSAPWVRGRARTVGLVVVAAVASALLLIASPRDSALGPLTQLTLAVLLPLFAGPWLAGRVRRRHWAPEREWRGLVAAIAVVVLGVAAFNEWGAEPMKQWIAERTGTVDATGQRKKVIVSVGVSINSPDSAASAPAMGEPPAAREPPLPDLRSRATNLVAFGFLTFWLAGGAGLWTWRRERAGLAALQRERKLAKAQAERREAELRLSVLAAQVEPHFLFNTLAGVRSAIVSDPGRASDMIDRLVDYLRAAIPRLRSDGGAQATLGGQLDIVRAYLGLMAARMPRLQFSVDAPVDLLNTPCPPLMLISLVENAVKHGVEPKIGPSRVDVKADRTGDGRIAVTVADDGAGFGTAPAGSGLGLTNIRERLQQMYQGRASLALKSRPEGGVAAILTFPLE